MAKNNNPGRILKGTKSQPSLKGASGVWTLDEALQYHRANQWPQPNLFQPVANSLRSKAASTSYFYRTTPRPGNRMIWTWSAWFKRSSTGTSTGNRNGLFGSGDSGQNNLFRLYFNATDNLVVQDTQNSADNLVVVTTQTFRDTNAWYHMVLAVDMTQSTGANRVKVYVNGVQVTSFSTATYASQGYSTMINGGYYETTGACYNPPTSAYVVLDGYIAEHNFIDGGQLQPTLFGQFDTNNTWVPVPYTGTYGTNGFYLPFTNATTSQTLGYDASLNGTTTYNADQDPYRGSVALHLTGNGPAGGQNNSFADSSVNNLAVTRSGSTTQGSFSPFPLNTNTPYNPAIHGGSAYFGTTTSDNIYAASNSALSIGTGNFTIEFWINWTTWAAEQRYVLMGQAGSSNIEISRTTAGGNTLYVYTNTSAKISASFTPTIGAWYHIAVVRSGTGSGQLALYINGVSTATGTSADSIANNNFFVGGLNWGTPYNHIGYISSLRFINGAAVYTAAFTPTMRPFGTLTNNLLPFSEDFTNSYWTVNAASITPGATIAPDGTPTGALFAWTTATAQHYIIRSSLTTIGNTVTASVYVKAKPNSAANWMIFGDLANNYMYINLLTGTIGTLSQITNAAVTSVGNGWFRISGTWTSGGASSGWGAYVASADNVSNPVGTDTTSGFYIWGAQLETGSTLGNYTPTPANYSTAPSLLLNFANAAVVDSSGSTNLTTYGSATISSANKYGSGALSFPGVSGSYLSFPGANFGFGAGNFTIELWVYLNSNGGNLVDLRGLGANGYTPTLYVISGSLRFYVNAADAITSSLTLTTGIWYHIALCKNNTTTNLFVNGQIVGTMSDNNSYIAPNYGIVGISAYDQTSAALNGLIDDLRMTKGVARYQSNFTPPARALPEVGGKSFITTNVNAGVVKSFTTTGTTSWTAPIDVSQIEVLVVAGGGGSGFDYSGGGGAGGLIYNNQYPVTPGQTYTVSVGAGGAGGTAAGSSLSPGKNGSSSVFGNLTAYGGGGGYGNGSNGYAPTAGTFGSGGGGSAQTAGGAGTGGQGFNGGTGGASNGAGGGGGGAGAVGGNGGASQPSNGGAGGVGLQFGISGTPTYYAGGGGGCSYATGVAGVGGSGGGGAGATGTANKGTDGTANTGGGGGGGAGAGGPGSAGGSGIVIVRYTTQAVGNTSDATTDNLVDSPTLYGHDTGAGGEVVGNYATWNPLDTATSYLKNGNLSNTAGGANKNVRGTIAVSSGKWYWEFTIDQASPTNHHGIWSISETTTTYYIGQTAGSWGIYDSNGNKRNNGSFDAYGSAYTLNDIGMVALDMDNGKIWWGKNGTWFNSGAPAAGTNAAFTNVTGTVAPATLQYSATSYNFGQRAWAYTPPAGFNALTTKNFPRLTNAAAIAPNQYFAVSTWTQGASDVTLINAGAFQPDLVWIKSRSNAQNNYLMDSVRGPNYVLRSNTSAIESNYVPCITFNSNGFTPSSTNTVTNTYTYVAWQWKAGGAAVSNTNGSVVSQVSANVAAGFSIVTYTGTGTTGTTVGHGLGVAPSFIIVKARGTTSDWYVWHTAIGDNFLKLDTTDGPVGSTSNGVFNTANFTSLVIALGNSSATNTSAGTYVAYCWSQIPGFSQFGSYSGNSSTDGPFVYCGFKPALVMIKGNFSAAASQWYVYDNGRDPNANGVVGSRMLWNATDADSTGNYDIDFVSNGFKLRYPAGGGGLNSTGSTYIYMAFAANPFGNANGTAR